MDFSSGAFGQLWPHPSGFAQSLPHLSAFDLYGEKICMGFGVYRRPCALAGFFDLFDLGEEIVRKVENRRDCGPVLFCRLRSFATGLARTGSQETPDPAAHCGIRKSDRL